MLNFPISSHLISSHHILSHLIFCTLSHILLNTAAVCCCFFPPCLFSFSCHFFLSESAGHQSGPHLSVWCLGPSPFFSGPPASWLQPLIQPSSFAPSACCQNSPHQSGTPALWKPVPIRLSSGTLYPFVFYHSSFGLTFSLNLLACRPSVTCRPFYLHLYSSSSSLFLFILSDFGAESTSNDTHLR